MGQPLPCCSGRDRGVQTETPINVPWVNPDPWVDNPQWTQLQRVAQYALHLMEPHKRPLAWYHCRGYHGQESCHAFIMAMDVDHETRNCPTCGHPWRFTIMNSQPCVAPLGDDAIRVEPGQKIMIHSRLPDNCLFSIIYCQPLSLQCLLSIFTSHAASWQDTHQKQHH